MMSFLNKLPFAHHGWFMYLRLLVRHFIEDDCQQKAASLTYTTLLSLVPILTVMLVVFSSVPALSGMREQMQTLIYNNLLPSSGAQLGHYFDSFAEKSSNLGIVGVIGLFITTIMTLVTIETAFNKIWRVKERSGGTASIIRYWALITLGPVVLGVAFGASSAMQSLDFLNRQIGGYGIDWSIWAYLVSMCITIAGFIGMYWFIPKVQVPIKNAVIAGIVSALLFEILRTIFGTVMSNFTSYEAIYGAFAALPIFLLWIYLSWNIILLGVEISYTLTIFDNKEVPVRHPLLSLLDMLNLAYKRYQESKTVSEHELREILGRRELPKWSLYIDQLVESELITRTKDDDYVLKTDLNSISLWQFYKTLPYPLPIKEELDALKAADYDPWFIELYHNLTKIERTAKDELNMRLAQLFDSAPLRQKEEIVHITDADADAKSDVDGFNHGTRREIDENGEVFIVPAGKAMLTESRLTKVIRLLKKAYHLFSQGKKTVNDVKHGLK
ncbi:YihY family inner membrane protein [Moraxella sp. Tifton1]|uniref:YihY family inner membrane protein n=1 Tax=Moraxella oculi TaxID=2940516 RepID=UPI00201333C2|nr:YhjD/YihY/BrkB family envelope integrity protein [Moraxella sp. Tifton1]MCL1623261.1 YihY family inner membrane protein [Moraxella sp. Tifton1]